MIQQIVLPYPIEQHKLINGVIQNIDLGDKTFRVSIPPNLDFGHKLRLKGLAGYLDESFLGQDLLLLLKKNDESFYSLKKDVLIELPIDLNSLKKKANKRVNILDKKFDVQIPLTAKYGQTLRLKNLAEICNGGHPGDVLLKISEMPNYNKGIFHNLFANFVGFDTPLSERTFKVVFKLPWLFEFSDEYKFKYSQTSVHGSY